MEMTKKTLNSTQQNDLMPQSQWHDGLSEPDFKIRLDNYQLRKNSDNFFVGRDKEKRKLKDILESNWDNGGSYLIAGYRGVGKTKFVKTTLDEYESENKRTLSDLFKRNKTKKPKKVLKINISLGNENRLDSQLVHNDIVSLMLEEFKEKSKTKLLFCRLWYLFPLLALALLSLPALETLPILGQPCSALINFINLSDSAHSEPTARGSFHWIYLLTVSLTFAWILGEIFDIFSLNSTSKIHRRLSRLLTNINHSSEISQGIRFKGVSSLAKRSRGGFNNNEIELELKKILKIATKSGWHIIFVFDELDKLTNRKGDVFEAKTGDNSESRNRKRQVDDLLGELKSLISTTQATYIFISGRDMYDAYLSELGSPNSLYESLFKDHIYIPSLLTDHSDENPYLLDSMVENIVMSQILPPEAAKLETSLSYLSLEDLHRSVVNNNPDDFFYVKSFVHFLTLHSWGNCKRIITLFDSFVVRSQEEEEEAIYYLEFSTKDIQRLMLASHLYILFHHHLGRVFINADDKLVVSSFAVFHYMMKFHDMGFSYSHINRMYQTLNVHSSPELAKVVEIIINKVLDNHIRKVRNSYYRYRFSSLYEQEIHYITTISDKESAAFSFSLDAMDGIKRTYTKMLAAELAKNNFSSKKAIANLHVILGNFHFWEQSFDEASTQYQSAISIYEKEDITASLDVLMSLIEAYMKQALVQERVGNYPLSAAIYTKAIEQVAQHGNSHEIIHMKDSKMDMLKQPYWALKFLHLKRSGIHYTEIHSPKPKTDISQLLDWLPNTNDETQSLFKLFSKKNYYDKFKNTDIWRYRKATIELYMGQPSDSYQGFMRVAKQLNVLNAHDERTCYLGGKSLLRAGYSLLIQHSRESHLKMRSRVLKLQQEKSEQNKSETPEKSKHQKRMMELVKMLEEYLPFLENALDALASQSSLQDLRKYVVDYKDDDTFDFKAIRREKPDQKDGIFPYAVGLISLSATAFERGRLNGNSAAAYLSVVSVWTLLQEMLPWRLEKMLRGYSVETTKTLANISRNLEKILDSKWAEEAETFAFERNSYSTSKAMSHSTKVLLRRSSGDGSKNEGLFSGHENIIEMVENPKFFKNHLYQHYSMLGQMTLSTVKWEHFLSARLKETERLKERLKETERLKEYLKGTERLKETEYLKEYLKKIAESLKKADQTTADNKILPFSVRYYSTMLWLQGREHLNTIVNPETKWEEEPDKSGSLNQELKQEAIQALVKLYRAAQYIVKTAGESSNTSLPPLFMIYYNMWEVVFSLVESLLATGEFPKYEMAVSTVVIELDKVLKESQVKDASSRIFDLSSLSVSALDHFSIALKMSDPSSREATNTLQSKYYLDDDFEDNTFTLDWCYTQMFAPGAYIHHQTIKTEMARLKEKFENQ